MEGQDQEPRSTRQFNGGKKSIDWWCDTASIIDPKEFATLGQRAQSTSSPQSEVFNGYTIKNDTGEANAWYCMFNGKLIKGAKPAIQRHIEAYLVAKQKRYKHNNKRNKNMTLVYSTETGRIKPEEEKVERPKGDGIVRIQRQTKGRKGKGVCIVTGLDLDDAPLKLLAAELKKVCGCGGSVKDGNIEIQGDARDKIKAHLEKKGMTVKLAGG